MTTNTLKRSGKSSFDTPRPSYEVAVGVCRATSGKNYTCSRLRKTIARPIPDKPTAIFDKCMRIRDAVLHVGDKVIHLCFERLHFGNECIELSTNSPQEQSIFLCPSVDSSSKMCL